MDPLFEVEVEVAVAVAKMTRRATIVGRETTSSLVFSAGKFHHTID